MARTERVTFEGSSGGQLAARLDLTEGDPKAYALFAHCFTCSKESFAASRISRALTDHGVAVLRFDFTGLGSSEGDFANTNFSSNIEDLIRAAEFLGQDHRPPRLLIGHSLGGAAVLAGAVQVPEAVGVVTIGAPFEPGHVTALLGSAKDAIESGDVVPVEIGGRQFTITRQFIEDVSSQSLTEAIGSLRRALLVFHAPLDDIVGVDNARMIFEAAKHPKSFVSLDTADHLLTNRADATYAAGVIAAWATRYLSE
jgi:fermentation-respiration switch protein FrsA (DUF1100 family)